MSSRYLRANGNWNGPVWAETENGVAGSAATPTAADTVYITANYTVTLTADSTVGQYIQSSGRLNVNGYKFTSLFDIDVLSGSSIFDMSNSTVETTGKNASTGFRVRFVATLISTNSLLILNVQGDINYSGLLIENRTLSDVRINMGQGSGSSTTLNITGSPTFRSLLIQSKNSAAHTVNFDGNVGTEKIILIGSGSSARLNIVNANSSGYIEVGGGVGWNTYYGQYVHIHERVLTSDGQVAYIGSNSIDDEGNFRTQDPPKISTLVDPLTTAPGSNSNWSIEDGAIQATSGLGGGGYESVGSNDVTMISTGTYDLVDSSIIYQIKAENNGINQAIAAVQWAWQSGVRPGAFALISGDNGYAVVGNYNPNPHDYEDGVDMDSGTVDTSNYLFVRISCSSSTGAMKTELSEGGVDWIVSAEIVLDDFELDMLRSTRIYATAFSEYGEAIIGSINMLPAPTSTGNFLPFFTP